jgi:hypothetical protein
MPHSVRRCPDTTQDTKPASANLLGNAAAASWLACSRHRLTQTVQNGLALHTNSVTAAHTSVALGHPLGVL